MNWALLNKYLAGEHTSAEKEEVEHWIRSDKRNQEFFDSLVKIWSIEPGNSIKIDAQDAWNSFKHKLSNEDEKDQESHQLITNLHNIRSKTPERKGYGRAAGISIAAAAIAVAVILLYVFLPDLGSFNNQFTQKGPPVQEVSTALGQRTSFRLADGTHVYLNAGSRFKISPAFGDSVRRVQLEGEAYFDVAHNPGIPFIVQSGNSFTRVLGTKFGIKAYPQDERVQVVVKEGEVALSSSEKNNRRGMHLKKNQVGLLNPDGEIIMKSIEDFANYLAWKEGQLVFESAPFEKVIPQLERWYNIEIEAEPSLVSQQVTATFDDEPMLEVLNILALSLDAGFQRDGRKISFNSEQHNKLN